MRMIKDEKELRELLPKYQFMMYNFENNHVGELTTLDEKDIDDIIADMNMGLRSAITYEKDGKIYVAYPHDICLLESRDLIKT